LDILSINQSFYYALGSFAQTHTPLLTTANKALDIM